MLFGQNSFFFLYHSVTVKTEEISEAVAGDRSLKMGTVPRTRGHLVTLDYYYYYKYYYYYYYYYQWRLVVFKVREQGLHA